MGDKGMEMYDLKLNEVMDIGDLAWVRRVPGGWIYEYDGGRDHTVAAVFVPYTPPDKEQT